MARQAQAKADRKDFFLYIDEFQNFITPSMSFILSSTRKYGLGCILAHQDMIQLQKQDTELASAVISNAGTRVCFRLGDIDARRFEDGFSSFEAQDLQNLGVGQAIMRIERPEFDFTIDTIELQPPSEEGMTAKDTVISLSRQIYGTPREEVEKTLEYLRGVEQHEETQPPAVEIKATEPLKKQPPITEAEKTASVIEVPLLDENEKAKTTENLVKQKEKSQHRYMQTLIKKMAEARGYKALIEALTPDGQGRVDVLLERGGKRIACEVGVTTSKEWETHNIEKCLAAGYEMVVAIPVDKKAAEVMQKQLAAELDHKFLSRVFVMEADALFQYLDAQVAKDASSETRMKGYRVKVEYEAVSEEVMKLKRDLITKMENDLEVAVEPVKLEALPLAEVITIKLKESEVDNWSEDEEKFATNAYLSQNSISHKYQRVWIKPATKQSRLGTVIDIKSSNTKTSVSAAYRINITTKVVFHGLPEIKQKVIDFSKIGGLQNIINKLREIIQVPLQYPELLTKFDIKPPKGLILHGPPGNGKTMIARAVSHSMGAKFISIEGPELLSKYVGVAEQKLREKFEEADVQGNCVIFIDEIDAIAASRDYTTAEHQISLVATLLTLMDGLRTNQRVFVLAATNRLHSVDAALRRPGRFDLEFEIPLPDKEARFDILKKYIELGNPEILQSDINNNYLLRLSEMTNGYSGADIFSLYREAAMNSIRKDIRFNDATGKIDLKSKPEDIKLGKSDFEFSLRMITPTSMRGIDVKRSNVHWEDLIGLEEIKANFEKLISLRNNDETKYNRRPSFFNILLNGKLGSGKSTLIEALAQKYHYEVLDLNFLNLQALGLEEGFTAIERLFNKAKQIAPTIIQITNLINVKENKTIFLKILNELDRLNSNYKILVIAESEWEAVTELLPASKGFGKVINFPETQPKETIEIIYKRFSLEKMIPFDEFLKESLNKGIGQILSEVDERLILKQ